MKIDFIELEETQSWKVLSNNKSSLPCHSHDYAKFCILNTRERPFLMKIKFSKFELFCPINIKMYKGYKIIKGLPGYTGFNYNLSFSNINQINKLLIENKILTFYFNSSPYTISKDIKASNFVSFKNNCYILDLKNNISKLKKDVNRNIKKNLIKTEESKIEIKEYKKLDFDIFRNLYLKTCARLNLDINSFYKISALEFLLNNYKNKIILVAKYKKKIISISVFIYQGLYSDYLLNFSDDDFNFCSSSLIIKSTELLRKKSIKYINLGGGIKDNDGLEKFKKSFNGVQKKIYSFKMISDKKIYNKFSHNLIDDYFPPFIK